MLGHTRSDTTMRYAHIQDAPLRAAANLFGDIYSQKTPKSEEARGLTSARPLSRIFLFFHKNSDLAFNWILKPVYDILHSEKLRP